jgi:dual specificity MAP kinase phosphatase
MPGRPPFSAAILIFCSCFVRARRLNVIIQPHLRFVFELMKWDELQQQARGELVKRDLEWPTVAREIAAMNRPYARS